MDVATPNEVEAWLRTAPPRKLSDAPERVRTQIRRTSHKAWTMVLLGLAQLPVLLVVTTMFALAPEERWIAVLMGIFAVSDTAFLWFAWTRWHKSMALGLRGQAHEGTVRSVELERVRRGESYEDVTEIFVSFTEHDNERWAKAELSHAKPRPEIEVGMPALVLLVPQRRLDLGVWAGNKFGHGRMVPKPHDIAES